MKLNLKVIYTFLVEFRTETLAKFDEIDNRFNVMQNSIDSLVKRHQIFETELHVQKHRIDKLEKMA